MPLLIPPYSKREKMLHVLIEEIHLFVQVLDRGEKIELLVDKTENLRSQVSPRKSLLEMN